MVGRSDGLQSARSIPAIVRFGSETVRQIIREPRKPGARQMATSAQSGVARGVTSAPALEQQREVLQHQELVDGSLERIMSLDPRLSDGAVGTKTRYVA